LKWSTRQLQGFYILLQLLLSLSLSLLLLLWQLVRLLLL
jgi:hypothetical protein